MTKKLLFQCYLTPAYSVALWQRLTFPGWAAPSCPMDTAEDSLWDTCPAVFISLLGLFPTTLELFFLALFFAQVGLSVEGQPVAGLAGVFGARQAGFHLKIISSKAVE